MQTEIKGIESFIGVCLEENLRERQVTVHVAKGVPATMGGREGEGELTLKKKRECFTAQGCS
jgi:hypothetical protein